MARFVGLVIDAARGAGSCLMCVLLCGAVWALCSCFKNFRIRRIRFFKGLLRAFRIDKFRDHRLTMVIAESTFTGDVGETMVRVTADDQVVETNVSDDKNYRQAFELLIPQGTREVLVELGDAGMGTIYATLPLDPLLDLRLHIDRPGFDRQVIEMDVAAEHKVMAPVHLTMAAYPENFAQDDRFTHILQHIDVEDRALVEEQLMMAWAANYGDGKHGAPSDFELSAKACQGPLYIYGGWGSRREVYVALLGPPDASEWSFCVWKNKEAWEAGKKPQESVPLLRVMSVQEEPTRADVFVINYMMTRTQRQRLVCERIDRARDVWVDMIKVCIDYLHEARERKMQKSKTGP